MSQKEDEVLDVLILGAGFSGLGMAAQLQKSGVNNFVLLEKADKIGGTWHFNRYPGCGCDVQSHLYSFSYFPKSDWTRCFAKREEIQQYAEDMIEQFGFRRQLQLGEEVTSATWSETESLWQVQTKSGRLWRSRFFVNACGPLHHPHRPQFSGLEQFQGEVLHTAEWDETFDSEGKTVLTVGTGASAIQALPELAKVAKHLHVLQRSPAWVIPKVDHAYSDQQISRFVKFPVTQKLHRLRQYLHNEAHLLPFYWPSLAKKIEGNIRNRILRHVADPQLAEKLTPSYRVGCKRILLSQDYYKMFARGNVTLHTESIDSFSTRGVRLANGDELEVDAVVLATGFVTDPRKYMKGLEITGKNHASLVSKWQSLPAAYLGMTIPDFPNFFLMVGPNTGLGHNSIIYMIERQAKYIGKCISKVLNEKRAALECRLEVFVEFQKTVQKKLQKSSWNSGCQSWYIDEKGQNFSIWPGTTFSYSMKTRVPRWDHFSIR